MESTESPNFHKVATERKSIRKGKIEKLEELDPKLQERIRDKALSAINEEAKEFRITDYGSLSGAKEALREQRQIAEAEEYLWLEEEKIAQEIGPVYTELSDLETQIADLNSFELRRLRESVADPHAKRTHERLLRTIQNERLGLESREKSQSIKYPIESRAVELVSYVRGLHGAGHIVPTPSVENYIHEIGIRMIGGKPMFLHGPTGTGKTSLARFASRHLTGVEAEMIYCNPQTRETNIHGKERIRPAGKDNASIETFFDWGPLAKAIRDGTPVIFDEFTSLPKEQMSMIKGIMSAKVGDTVQITGDGPTVIAPGFQMIFTANLKSEKNPERQDIPPEVANEFDQNNLHIGYTPKEEAYDIMLARLLNPDGSIDLSDYDLAVTLPKFCEALYEIQTAYTGEANEDTARLTGTLPASGKRLGLKKLVMNQRTVEAVIDSWKIEKARGSSTSFTEFLDHRLSFSLTFKEYPEGDRILAGKILASKGFLRTKTAEELGLPKNTFDFDAAKKLRGNRTAIQTILDKSRDVKHISLKEIALLDPFNVRALAMNKKVNEFIGSDTERDEEQVNTEVDAESLKQANQQFIKETFTGWYQNATAAEIERTPAIITPLLQPWDALKADVDVAKSGEYTLNPETQNLDFEHARTFIPDLTAFNGKHLAEVAKHIVGTYGDRYHIPGIEYWKWLIENPDKSPPELKDGKYHFFFGSTLRNQSGHWSVPCAYWVGAQWNRRANWLDGDWNSVYRVVLLEK